MRRMILAITSIVVLALVAFAVTRGGDEPAPTPPEPMPAPHFVPQASDAVADTTTLQNTLPIAPPGDPHLPSRPAPGEAPPTAPPAPRPSAPSEPTPQPPPPPFFDEVDAIHDDAHDVVARCRPALAAPTDEAGSITVSVVDDPNQRGRGVGNVELVSGLSWDRPHIACVEESMAELSFPPPYRAETYVDDRYTIQSESAIGYTLTLHLDEEP